MELFIAIILIILIGFLLVLGMWQMAVAFLASAGIGLLIAKTLSVTLGIVLPTAFTAFTLWVAFKRTN
jgi:hypothetical protein